MTEVQETKLSTQRCPTCSRAKPLDQFIGKYKPRTTVCKSCRVKSSSSAERSRNYRAVQKLKGIRSDKRTAENRREYFRKYRAKKLVAARATTSVC